MASLHRIAQHTGLCIVAAMVAASADAAKAGVAEATALCSKAQGAFAAAAPPAA